ncbi:hypothetical protein SEQU_11730 [Staphylococcus equorum UMC-CNS-924]|nr:hypothetical protein SEQU_11730 [Staphylococcus equorum UMC-CNS-924]CCI60205.1 putative uncharacterized protein [Staphylococcus equorum subsp. equorum Mu2]
MEALIIIIVSLTALILVSFAILVVYFFTQFSDDDN